MKTVATHEAKTHLSRILAETAAGEEYIITRGATPVARLIPASAPTPRPKVGQTLDRKRPVPPDALRPLAADELAAWGL